MTITIYQLGYSSPGGFTLVRETTDPEETNRWLQTEAPEGEMAVYDHIDVPECVWCYRPIRANEPECPAPASPWFCDAGEGVIMTETSDWQKVLSWPGTQ